MAYIPLSESHRLKEARPGERSSAQRRPRGKKCRTSLGKIKTTFAIAAAARRQKANADLLMRWEEMIKRRELGIRLGLNLLPTDKDWFGIRGQRASPEEQEETLALLRKELNSERLARGQEALSREQADTLKSERLSDQIESLGAQDSGLLEEPIDRERLLEAVLEIDQEWESKSVKERAKAIREFKKTNPLASQGVVATVNGTRSALRRGARES